MKYRITNIYNSKLIEFDVDYVIFHSGIGVLRIHTDKNKTTIILTDRYYDLHLFNNDLHIRKN